MPTASEALIDLALAEQAISDADARRLRFHVVKKNADAPAVERLLVRHHGVPPERARALRQRVEPPAPVAVAPAAPEVGGELPAVLIIYPGDGAEPTAAQRAAASELGGADADALVRDPLPRVERAGTRAELRPLAARLRAAGIDARATAPPALALPRSIQRARLDKARLILSGPDGEVEADPSKPTLVVVGRSDDGARYLHLYAGGRAAPFEVHERSAFPGLGTQRDPFHAFLSSLQSAGGVSVCDLLLLHAGRVEQATLAVELPAPGPRNVASPRAIALSRLLYETWLDGLSLDPTTLELAVVDKQAERASGRQPRPEHEERPAGRERAASGRLLAPERDASPSALEPPVQPDLSHVLRGGSLPEQLAGMKQKAPAPAAGSAEAYLAQAGEVLKTLGPQRLMAIAAVGVLLFLIFVFVKTGSGVRFHVKEDPAHAEAASRKTIRVVVLADNNRAVDRKFRVAVLGSDEIQGAHDYVWQDDREEPRNGGYDRSPDYQYMEQGTTGELPCVFIYNSNKQMVTGVRGAGNMTPAELLAFVKAAAADPRSGQERRESQSR